jgi:hypothetical protein
MAKKSILNIFNNKVSSQGNSADCASNVTIANARKESLSGFREKTAGSTSTNNKKVSRKVGYSVSLTVFAMAESKTCQRENFQSCISRCDNLQN